MNNNWDQNCWDFITKQEGNPLNAYWDDGWACGRGIHAPDINQNTRWTAAESDNRFRLKLNEYRDGLNSLIDIILPQPCFNALEDWAYNIRNSIKQFEGSTLRRLINEGRLREAADLLPEWCHKEVAGKMVVDENLLERRNLERAMFLSGIGGGPALPEVPPAAPQAVPVVVSPVPVRVPVAVGSTADPFQKISISGNLTKWLMSAVTLATAILQDPTARAVIFGFLGHHKQLSTLIAGIGAIAALLHDPNKSNIAD